MWIDPSTHSFHIRTGLVKKEVFPITKITSIVKRNSMQMFIVGLSSGKAEGQAAIALVETFGEYQINKGYTLRHAEQFKLNPMTMS